MSDTSNTSLDASLSSFQASLSQELKEEISKIKDELAILISARDSVNEENLIRRTSREIATLSIHLVQKESELAEIKLKEIEYINRIYALEVEIENLRGTVNALFSSTSWKLTAPVRRLVRLLKRS